jgi:MYXO-CTERM domain-containing protein
MRAVLVVFTLLSCSSWVSTAWAEPTLTSEDSFTFDFYAESSGYMSNGLNDAYDGCYDLQVNGTAYAAGGAHEDYYGGRGWRAREQTVGDLRVRRHGYVPAAGPSYARYIDTVENTGAGAIDVTFRYHCNLGSDGSTELHATEDGDQSFETADAWIETDDGDGVTDPSLGHVFFQPGAEVTTDTATHQAGDLVWTYVVSIGAGETAAIMVFGIQQSDRAAAHADVLSAVDLEDPALAEVGDEFGYVRNFVMGGAPLLRSGGPYEVAEGSCVALEATADDREGDSVTIAWDLDDDGTYEHEDAAGEYCATDLDGPSSATVGILAVDGAGNAVERDVTITVLNVAPMITSAPPSFAIAGGHYEHQLEVTDAAGALDPLVFAFTNGDDEDFPLGLQLSPPGLLTWDPLEFQAGQTYTAALVVDDGDDGQAELELTIDVRDNTAPTAPQPAYPTLTDPPILTVRPILIARNADDADGDALTYTFQLSDNVGFVGATVSPALPQGGEGATQWEVTMDLVPGQSYYWKVEATDGIDESQEGFSSFTVSPDAEGGGGDGDADADADGGADLGDDGDAGGGRDRGAGCACATANGQDDGAMALALAGLVLALTRRRR